MYQDDLRRPKTALRFRSMLIILLAIGLALCGRMLYLTVFNHTFLKSQGDLRALRTVEVPAYRGMILDRNGYPLAISTPVDAVWVDPISFDAQNPNILILAKLLSMSSSDIITLIRKNPHREFLYLKRGLDPVIGQKIKALHIPGIYIQRQYRRYYPDGEVTAHLLGFTNIDDHGQEGMEMAYDGWLSGHPGKIEVLKDRLGRIVADVRTIKSAVPGQNLVLSIDHRIQFLAYQALQDGVQKYQAVSGSAIVLDVKTGEVLAVVNAPSYNPNNRPAGHSEVYRNRAFTDVYEPGSVMKSLSMASALSSGKWQPNSIVDTNPGYLYVDGHKIEDEGHNLGVINMATLLAKSSNIGMSKVTLSLPYDRLWQTFHAFGFGQSTGSNFPGESTGVLRRENPWRLFDLCTMSFGYGVSVTPMQIARAYASFGNHGVLLPISLLKISQPPKGQQVVSDKVASDMLTLLQSVIYGDGSTAPLARVPGYRVTGKTGTSWILGPHGYMHNRHNGTFVGMVPASDPKILVLVTIHDPHGRVYYGGYTAGPVFANIMGSTLRLLGILPDDVSPDTAPPSEQAAVSALSNHNEGDN